MRSIKQIAFDTFFDALHIALFALIVAALIVGWWNVTDMQLCHIHIQEAAVKTIGNYVAL